MEAQVLKKNKKDGARSGGLGEKEQKKMEEEENHLQPRNHSPWYYLKWPLRRLVGSRN
jgi:hypothetical protein